MATDSVIQWVKCVLSMLVVILWFLSITLIFVCCWIRDNLSVVVQVAEGTNLGDFYLGTFFPEIFPVLIAVSCLLLVIGCIGCCGTLTENQLLLGWFFFSILVTFCIELSAGIWRLVDWKLAYHSDDIDQLYVNAKKYSEDNQYGWYARAWRSIHSKFKCCGIRSYEDWQHSPHIQATCCELNQEQSECIWILSQNKVPGCGEDLMEFLTKSSPMDAVPYLTTMIGTVQIICLILTLKLWLFTCFRNHKKNPQWISESNIKYAAQNHGRATTLTRYDENSIPLLKLGNIKDYSIKKWGRDLETHRTCPECNLSAYEEIQFLPMGEIEREHSWKQTHLHAPSKIIFTPRPIPRYPTAELRSNTLPHIYPGVSNASLARSSNLNIHRSVSAQLTSSTSAPFTNATIRNCQRPHIYPGVSHTSLARSSNLNMHRSVSAQLTSSTSAPFANATIRDCQSAALPRKNYPQYTARELRRMRRNDGRRLSPIRASGIAATSDTSVTVSREILGENRCNNTEVERSSSEEERSIYSAPKSVTKLYRSVPATLINSDGLNIVSEIQKSQFEDKRKVEVSNYSLGLQSVKLGYTTL